MSERYRTIVVDPPWDYEPFVSINRTQGKWSERVEKPLPYRAMSIGDIIGLPIAGLAHPDGAYLFCWTTSRYLPTTLAEILPAWGFTYRQTLVWHKVKSVSPFGGSIAPNHAEFLLVAKRGSPRLVGRATSSVIDAPGMSGRRSKAHSKKPDAFLDLIELVSPEPRCELFARRARLGWDYPIGDQALGGVAA